MFASFIIGFHTQRKDNLLQTLGWLEKHHLPVVEKSQLVLICQDRCNLIENRFARYTHVNLQLTEMMLPFVTNTGVSSAFSDKLVILESDRLCPAGYYEDVLTNLQAKTQVTCFKMRKLKAPRTDEQIESGDYEWSTDNRSEDNRPFCKNMWSGNTVCWKSDYVQAGGMDEEYVGYGWADTDMTKRMQSIGVTDVWRPETEIHLWHPPMTYGTRDQTQLFIDNGLRCCRKWDIPVPSQMRKVITDHKRILL